MNTTTSHLSWNTAPVDIIREVLTYVASESFFPANHTTQLLYYQWHVHGSVLHMLHHYISLFVIVVWHISDRCHYSQRWHHYLYASVVIYSTINVAIDGWHQLRSLIIDTSNDTSTGTSARSYQPSLLIPFVLQRMVTNHHLINIVIPPLTSMAAAGMDAHLERRLIERSAQSQLNGGIIGTCSKPTCGQHISNNIGGALVRHMHASIRMPAIIATTAAVSSSSSLASSSSSSLVFVYPCYASSSCSVMHPTTGNARAHTLARCFTCIDNTARIFCGGSCGRWLH